MNSKTVLSILKKVLNTMPQNDTKNYKNTRNMLFN